MHHAKLDDLKTRQDPIAMEVPNSTLCRAQARRWPSGIEVVHFHRGSLQIRSALRPSG